MAEAVIEEHDALYAARRERFNRILDHHELGAGDWDILGSPSLTRDEAKRALPIERIRTDGPDEALPKPGRWVVIARSSRGHGWFASNHATLSEAQAHAGENVHEAWHPVCVYDLGHLSGDIDVTIAERVRLDPAMAAQVTDEDGWLEVIDHDWRDGRATVTVKDGRWFGVEELAAADPDDRLPLRYNVAGVETVVSFNSTPETT
jgi:hypothetical protein